MTVASKSAAKGRPHRLGSAELDVIRQLALANPAAPIVELTRMLSEQLGARIDRFMMARALKRAGVQRVRRAKRATPRLVSTHHRFTDEHRAEAPPPADPSSLTDHEWSPL